MAQIHPDESHSSIARSEIDATLAQPNGLDTAVEAPAPPACANNQQLEDSRVLLIARSGALMIIALQFAYLEWDLSIWRILPAGLMGWHVGSILVGFVALGLTFFDRSWPARHWRAMAFWTCAATIAGIAGVSRITGASEPLFVACLLFIVASGSTIPWEPQWQAAFNLVPLVALLIVVPSTYDGFNGLQWIAITAALIYAQITNLTSTRFREELPRHLVQLRASEERLRTEIKERERTARDLSEKDAVLRTIFDAAVDLVTIVRFSDGKVIDVNQAVEQYGLTREMAVGSTALALGVWPDPAGRTEFLEQLMRQGVVRNRELEMRCPDGVPVTMLVSAALAEIGGDKCVVAIWRDVGALKENERELIAAREEALAASQAKSDFLSGMSHEIRTPMNAILGMSELLADTPLNDQQRKYLDVMQANGNSPIALINDILDLARVESGRLNLEQAPFDLEALMDTVGEALAVGAHAKGLELVVHLTPLVPRNLVGDPLRLKQVLINLIGNAIKFTACGEIVVTVERLSGADAAVQLRFAVADTGIGIPEAKLPSLFSSFTQVDSSVARKYGGSGLGLSIVRRLVELMGGRTWAESSVGAGSTFYFTANFGLNAGPSINGESPATGRASPVSQLAGMRALVVDDNRINRMVVREIMAAHGADVAVADSGLAALSELKSARRSGRPFDLMILDCQMPDMDGFKVVQQLRRGAERDDTVVLMLTSNDLNIQIPRVRELGLDAYIVKPVGRAELLAAIAAALAAHNRASVAGAAAKPLAPNGGDTAAADARADAAQAESPAANIFARLLLADDSADNRLLINSYLKRMPYRIDEAQNGEEAYLKAIATRYDLILMDLQMPVMDGLVATRMIRDWELANGAPRTPIIVLTASVLEDDVRKTLAAGADTHLSKPVTRGMLLQAIRELNADDADASSSHHDGAIRER
jgi:two-component system, sensor histidine kinase and response regulator